MRRTDCSIICLLPTWLNLNNQRDNRQALASAIFFLGVVGLLISQIMQGVK